MVGNGKEMKKRKRREVKSRGKIYKYREFQQAIRKKKE